MDNGQKPFGKIISKLRKIKNIEVIVCIIFIAVVLLIYAERSVNKPLETENESAVEVLDESLEYKLEDVLSSIDGAGNVKVLITYDDGGETVTAVEKKVTTTKREDTSGGSTLVTETIEESDTPVFSEEGSPIIVKELSPEIRGVIIVAEGADSIKVRLELMRAAAKALDVDASLIEIFEMN